MTPILPLALIVFLTSGVAALLYQVVWQRMLAIFSGADVYSATVIVAAFMGGLGLGHLAGGHVADRVSRRGSLALFAAAELTVALFGLFSASLYHGVLYERLGPLSLGPGAIAGVLFVSLLFPTFFMGASLPLLARAITDRIERAAFTVGALYGFNTVGAALGALVATWVTLPRLGLEGSLVLAAALNAACAAALLPAALWPRARRDVDMSPWVLQHAAAAPAPAGFPFWFWALAYGFAGFVALSYEIVWFRLLGVMVKSTAFTFGTLLAVYLSGIGLGAVAGSVMAPRTRRPAAAFFVLQASAGLLGGLLLAILVGAADDIRALRGYFSGYEPLNVRSSVHALRVILLNVFHGGGPSLSEAAAFLRLYVGVPLLLVLPPTLLMGSAFPFLQRVVQTDIDRLGRRVGVLLVANIIGSLLGTVTTAWVALAVIGTAATVKMLAALSGVFALLAVIAARREWAADGRASVGSPRARLMVGLAAAAVVVVVLLMPNAAQLWARLHGTSVGRIIFAEDSSGVSVIRAERDDFDGPKIVFVNGMGQSVLPYGDIHTALGALPALVHPRPRDVAIIGLGSGDTVYAASARPEVEHLTAIEIIRPQLATLRALAERNAYPGLHALLRDARVQHVFGDGRAYLMRTPRTFDIIEADALRPTSAYSGNLYSGEYFELVRRRLKVHGLAATWAPTRRIHDTFVSVFPYVVSVPGILLGSNEPFDIDRTAVAARASAPRVVEHYRRAGIDIGRLLAMYLDGELARFGEAFDRTALTDVNTDLFPKDEFDLSPP